MSSTPRRGTDLATITVADTLEPVRGRRSGAINLGPPATRLVAFEHATRIALPFPFRLPDTSWTSLLSRILERGKSLQTFLGEPLRAEVPVMRLPSRVVYLRTGSADWWAVVVNAAKETPNEVSTMPVAAMLHSPLDPERQQQPSFEYLSRLRFKKQGRVWDLVNVLEGTDEVHPTGARDIRAIFIEPMEALDRQAPAVQNIDLSAPDEALAGLAGTALRVSLEVDLVHSRTQLTDLMPLPGDGIQGL